MYTRIALRALKVSYRDVGEGRLEVVNCEKTQFSWTPCIFLKSQGFKLNFQAVTGHFYVCEGEKKYAEYEVGYWL